MARGHSPVHQIELHVSELAQLFNSMDPSPFPNRDLDPDAEEFIESWALEFPRNSRFRIVVHIDKPPPEDAGELVTQAIHNYFHDKSLLARRSLRLLFIEGRTSLLIGLGFLALCLIGADLLTAYNEHAFPRILRESLVIGGWVAMWRPIQIFLYEWWPIARRGNICRNLAHAHVHITPGKPADGRVATASRGPRPQET